MKKNLTNKDKFRLEVNNLLRKYRKVLLIPKTWKIITYIHADKKEFAIVNYDYSKREFIIHINHSLNLTPKDLRDTIIHELCHIFISSYTSYVSDILDKMKNKERIRWAQTKEVLEDKEEKIVKKLTKIIQNLEIKEK